MKRKTNFKIFTLLLTLLLFPNSSYIFARTSKVSTQKNTEEKNEKDDKKEEEKKKKKKVIKKRKTTMDNQNGL